MDVLADPWWCPVTAYIAHMPLPELLGWVVVVVSAAIIAARYGEAGWARLVPYVRRAAVVLVAYARSRASAARRPGGTHRAPHPAARTTTDSTSGGTR